MTNEEIIKELSGKTVLEINELVKALEEAWGVSAAAAVAVAAPGAGGAAAALHTVLIVLEGHLTTVDDSHRLGLGIHPIESALGVAGVA